VIPSVQGRKTMGLWDSIRGMLGGKQRGVGVSTPDVAGASFMARGPPRRGTRELLQAYREQPWLRAVTSKIARGVASTGWTVYARSEVSAPLRGVNVIRSFPGGRGRDVVGAPQWNWRVDRAVADPRLNSVDFETRARRRVELSEAGLLREVPDHPLLSLLRHPNKELTGRHSIQMTQTWLDIKGEGFWLLQRGKQGTPIGYMPIPPHWVTSVPTVQKPVFRISYGTLQLDVQPNDMMWFRDPDPENPYARGTGVAESLGDELETDEYAAKYLKNWFFNSATPSMLVSLDGASAADVKLAKEKWESEHRGFQNAHRAHFMNGKMNAIRLDASFRDQQISDLRKLSRDTIAQVFAMPPEMLGIIENSNRSTIGAARFIYAIGVEFPRCESLRAELQQQLVPMFDENAVLECEVNIPDDEDRRLNVMKSLPGGFSVNEWRAEAAYPSLPEFDGVFPSLAMPGQNPADGAPTEADDEDEAEPPTGTTADTADAEAEEKAARALREPPWVSNPIR